ncbi:hypothetical protein EVC24_051 [Rhizobium phage RHph_I4]|nr:hypothetical protein EVC24_051 [Rhizobium phage RHph_I4]
MSDTRTRVRRPDAEEAADQPVTSTEEIKEALGLVQPVAEQVTATPIKGPFRREGFHIVDASGRRIAMCGVEGDIVRTGPGIAEAFLLFLNKEFAEAGRT